MAWGKCHRRPAANSTYVPSCFYRPCNPVLCSPPRFPYAGIFAEQTFPGRLVGARAKNSVPRPTPGKNETWGDPGLRSGPRKPAGRAGGGGGQGPCPVTGAAARVTHTRPPGASARRGAESRFVPQRAARRPTSRLTFSVFLDQTLRPWLQSASVETGRLPCPRRMRFLPRHLGRHVNAVPGASAQTVAPHKEETRWDSR